MLFESCERSSDRHGLRRLSYRPRGAERFRCRHRFAHIHGSRQSLAGTRLSLACLHIYIVVGREQIFWHKMLSVLVYQYSLFMSVNR